MEENDHNNDGFRDMPLTKRYGVTNRWRYVNDKVEGHIVGGFMHIENEGGQIGFNPGTDKLGTDKYGVGIGARQYYAYWKNGFLFPKLKFASLGLIGHWKRYEQESYFGTREYTGTQDHAYFNAIYSDILGNTFHNVTTGLGVVYDNMNERLIDSTFSREEIVPGAFFEYTYKPSLRVSVVAGIRGDYNMYFDKLWVSPRLHAKYFISENLAVRVGGGRSYRTPNTISENIMLLASSRDVIVEETIQYEEAWNYGGSITWDFKVKKREGTLRLDAYQTVFENQLIVDRDISASQVHFYNLTGESYSTVLQADLNYSPHKQIRFNSAYKWSNVKATLAGKLQQVPLVPEHRVMLSAGFKDRKDIWQLDLTANWFGTRRLPNTIMNPQEYQLPTYSSDYWQLNAQLTKAFRRFEVYAGAENILNFKQENAIIAANDPFGTYFDASNIWGPLNGRVIYIGLRTKFR